MKIPFKEQFRRLWSFLWDQESGWSWLANVVLAFLLIRFIVYPLLGLMLGTGYPIVAVVSGSMEHNGNFDSWWDSRCTIFFETPQGQFYESVGISKDEFKSFPFPNGFNTGDVIILTGAKPEEINVGDVLVYWASRPEPIIHRVIVKSESKESGNSTFFAAKGDHNCFPNPDERSIPESKVIGKARFKVPYLGWVKIGALRGINSLLAFFGVE